MNKLPPIREHQLQTLLINYLTGHGYYVQRLNAGKYPMGEGRNRRFVQGVAVGTPDIIAFKDIHGSVDLMFIEVKVPGNKPTLLQTIKMQELEEHGAKCYVIHSLEELEEKMGGGKNDK